MLLAEQAQLLFHGVGRIVALVDGKAMILRFGNERYRPIQQVPVVGDQEQQDGTVTPRRRRDSKRSGEAIAVDAFVSELASEIARRRA